VLKIVQAIKTAVSQLYASILTSEVQQFSKARCRK